MIYVLASLNDSGTSRSAGDLIIYMHSPKCIHPTIEKKYRQNPCYSLTA